jgi:prepilin-type N-terminal cleavage/methylation domain-containing protein
VKRTLSLSSHKQGFTLVEIIITIIVAGILGAFFIHFLGTALDQSSQSIDFVQGEAAAEATMTQIIADFVAETNENPDTALATIAGRSYGSGVSMAYIEYVISGSDGQEQTVDSSNTLKVTIDAEGDDLTMLLTRSRADGASEVIYPTIEY